MFKIWVKLYRGDKMFKNFVYNNEKTFQIRNFDEYLREICSELDIPTPLVLTSHKHHFQKFNQTKFKKSDFIESINFDDLILENVPDETKKSPSIYSE